ncbi:MAG: hypothetical protein IH859_10460 [Chloroflexi bacterium]|nr:hypothetical protein [Chloroflexota bacterium]
MRNNKSNKDATPPEKLEWFEIINVLNKFLPTEFPLVEKPVNTNVTYLRHKGSAIVSVNKIGAIEYQVDLKSLADAAVIFAVLNQFAREYSTSRTQDFIYANLPFQFSAKNFVKMYKSRVYREQMEEMLDALGLGDTARSYCDEFEFQFKLHPITKFVKNFLIYDRQQTEKSAYTFKEIITKLKVTKNQLIKWAPSKYLKKTKRIHIELDTSKIIYRPRRSN